jgi:hypothetical protein
VDLYGRGERPGDEALVAALAGGGDAAGGGAALPAQPARGAHVATPSCWYPEAPHRTGVLPRAPRGVLWTVGAPGAWASLVDTTAVSGALRTSTDRTVACDSARVGPATVAMGWPA